MDIGFYLHRTASRHPHNTAVVDGDRRLTYTELNERVTRVANALHGLGLRPGDRIVDLQRNSLEYLETDLALARAGLVRVAVNTRLQLDDWIFIARDCGARGLIAGAEFGEQAASLATEADSIEHLVTIGGGPGSAYEDLLTSGSARAPECKPELDALVSLNYSSGTTGRPKGCMRTHRNRFASMRDMLINLFERPLRADDVWLHAGPMTHASGLFAFPHVVAGGTQVMMHQFDPEHVLSLIAAHKITGTVWVPTMIERVLASGLATAELSSVRRITYAGAPMAPDRIRAAHDAFAGRLTQFYGMVEAIPPLAVLTQRDHAAAIDDRTPGLLDSAGRAVLGCELDVVDDGGAPVGVGEVGELVVSGDHVMAGYWGKDDATGKVLRDGRLWTGDLARADAAGYITIIDRRTDMIISGGYNVYPREVEDVIVELDGVDEVAVVGTPDPEWGQAVTAFAVTRQGSALTSEAILAHCKARLAGFKKPRRVEIVDALPKGSTGKISRKALRDHAEREVRSIT